MPNPRGSVRAALRLRRERATTESPSLWRRAAAVITTVVLAGGLIVVGAAAPASAHTGDLKANAVCNTTTGQYDVTYTLTLSNTGGKTGTTRWRVGDTDFDGTPNSNSGMDRGPITTVGDKTVTLGTESLPGTTKGAGPWVYAYTTWNDYAKKGSDGRIEGLNGDCGKDSGNDKITFCHSTSSSKNAYNLNTTSIDAFVIAGHIGHKRDIYPAFSYETWFLFVKTVHKVPAQGDQTLLAYPDCVKTPSKIDVPAAPAFSDSCGTGNTVFTEPTDTAELDWTTVRADGKITVSVKPQAGFAFKSGEASKTFEPFVINDEPCPPTKIAVPAAPAFSDSCGTGNTVFTEPTDTAELDWTTVRADGKITVSVKPQAGFAFESGEASKTFEPFVINDGPCPIAVPAAPAFSDSCGTGNTVFTEPTDTAELDWTTVRADGKITVSVKPQAGFAFESGEASKTFEPFVIDDEPCPPTVITFGDEPTSSDLCGPENGKTVIPKVAADAHYSFVVTGSEAEGSITVTAVAEDGFTFDGKIGPWTFTFMNTPCLELQGAPTRTDECDVDNDAIVLPSKVEHVTWTIEGDAKAGTATAIATADEGYAFSEGKTKSFPFTFTDEDCVEPTLTGSVATGECIADAPWISYEILLTDPDHQSESDTASLVLTDGTNTETIELGELVDGALTGKVLWPGASVAEDGVTPTGWPGWEQLSDGTWQETDGNFAWSRTVTSATLHVNPSIDVDLVYPPATPDCVAAPPTTPGGKGGVPLANTGGGDGLAETGFNGGTFALIAGLLLAAGAAVLVVLGIRRRRAKAGDTSAS